MQYVVLIGRILYSVMFLVYGVNHFTSTAINYAESQQVPMAAVLVPISGIIAIVGGLSIALGYKAKAGAWLLVLFLIPVTFVMHNFWTIMDPTMRGIQMSMFLKNVSLLGVALYLTHYGAGPMQLENKLKST